MLMSVFVCCFASKRKCMCTGFFVSWNMFWMHPHMLSWSLWRVYASSVSPAALCSHRPLGCVDALSTTESQNQWNQFWIVPLSLPPPQIWILDQRSWLTLTWLHCFQTMFTWFRDKMYRINYTIDNRQHSILFYERMIITNVEAMPGQFLGIV